MPHRQRRACPGARAGLALLAAATLATACSDDGGSAPREAVGSTTTTTIGATSTVPAPPVDLAEVDLALAAVAPVDLPTALAVRPGSPDLYVAEQAGRVRRIDVTPPPRGSTRSTRYELVRTPVLDLGDEMVDDGERGLLGLAFSGDGRTLYVHYSARPDGGTLLVAYGMGDDDRVELDSRRELLALDQPAPNHNGGQLAVGPDGYLYMGLGDGGGAGDPHGNAQDPDSLLGKILRIDPEAPGPGGAPYSSPAGNPFAVGGGRPEIWLYGVRNPWRFSFDRATGDLWVADVGQDRWEEIDLLPAAAGFDAGRGANLGWDRLEGTHRFEGSPPEGAVPPVFEYSHNEGCSVTGGYVYRGAEIPALVGAYVFGDYCAPGLRGIVVRDGTTVAQGRWELGLEGVSSLGEGPDGELYVLSAGSGVARIVAR